MAAVYSQFNPHIIEREHRGRDRVANLQNTLGRTSQKQAGNNLPPSRFSTNGDIFIYIYINRELTFSTIGFDGYWAGETNLPSHLAHFRTAGISAAIKEMEAFTRA